jgi:hypothetical protein
MISMVDVTSMGNAWSQKVLSYILSTSGSTEPCPNMYPTCIGLMFKVVLVIFHTTKQANQVAPCCYQNNMISMVDDVSSMGDAWS